MLNGSLTKICNKCGSILTRKIKLDSIYETFEIVEEKTSPVLNKTGQKLQSYGDL